ncbi:EF-hand domain-containing protein [Nonlabens mediterrranea]|uniref:EF-hand domain-containing protein n=1 Tax=Nonlabens mediterrranea TaxID=1419947 RepID=A0ABS0A766_9FLAO|nr:EF-hand domain-containing protein [Nonlabens mediterrranea]
MDLLKTTVIAIGLTIYTSCGSSKTTDNTTRSKNGEKPDAATLIQQMDTNKDGKLSIEEVQGPLKNDFDKIDTDDDGFLSIEELKNAPVPERRSGGPNPEGRTRGGR